jgi:hypothetical protein
MKGFEMKKLLGAAAVCGLAVGLVAVPGAGAVKAPKQVGGSVSVFVTPTTITPTTTTVTATGNVQSNSGCRKLRTVEFAYVTGGVAGPVIGSATTGSNGGYTATLPKPTNTPPAVVALRATVTQTVRKVGSKKKGQKPKKGRQFNCLSFFADSSALTVSP